MRSYLPLLAVLACGICHTGCTVPPSPGVPSVPGAAAAAAPAGALAAAGAPAAAAPAAAAHPTLPQFLGLTGLGEHIHNGVRHIQSHLGMENPLFEPTAALLPITEAGGDGATPEVNAAAKQKAQQEKTDQKIKALRYLTSQGGCGKCFPDTEEAILSSLKDCVEQVRFEAGNGLRKVTGDNCYACRVNSCCTEAILKRLHELAFGQDSNGCPLEPSPRIRRVARVAIMKCGNIAVTEDEPEPEPAAPEEAPSLDEAAPTIPTSTGPVDPSGDAALSDAADDSQGETKE